MRLIGLSFFEVIPFPDCHLPVIPKLDLLCRDERVCTLDIVITEKIGHTYPARKRSKEYNALKGVDLSVKKGDIFGFLGPNGSGKTTLFKILSTLITPTSGRAEAFGFDISKQKLDVRKKIGVVFQFPSLDRKLTVEENLYYQGHLYGLNGSALTERIGELLIKFQLEEKRDKFVETLSGGQKRRVEIAKGLMHRPELLIMDEPSTGLDIRARRSMWNILEKLKNEDGVTVLLTTHLMNEAEQCDHIVIMDNGKVEVNGKPEELKKSIGADIITVSTDDPESFIRSYSNKYEDKPLVVNGKVRIEKANGHRFVPQIVDSFPDEVTGVTFGRPTLEDVFIQKTGRGFLHGEKEQE